MIRRVTIVPTITTADPAVYRSQMERINLFSHHVHIDVTDGVFAKNQTIRLGDVAWPQGWQADLHLMVAEPSKCVGDVIRKMPSLCSFHAEVQEDLTPSFAALKEKGIKTGLVLLQSTFPGAVKQYIEMVDHVLIFAGQLGMQGGTADMMQMEKIALVRAIKPDVEIGWDGGANMTNIRALAHADLDVINVGSALAKAENPKAVYEEMVAEIDKSGVMI